MVIVPRRTRPERVRRQTNYGERDSSYLTNDTFVIFHRSTNEPIDAKASKGGYLEHDSA